jgi:hypothetical protein
VNIVSEYSDARYLTRIFLKNEYLTNQISVEFKVPDWLTIDFKRMNFESYKVQEDVVSKNGYTTYKFGLTNVDPSKSEYRRIGRSSTDPHIIILVKSFENKGETYKAFDKIDDVYAWNNRLYKMANNDQTKLKSVVTKLLEGKKTDIEKVKAIYYWVQDNIRYIAYEDGYSGYIPFPTQEVVSKKYGDCKGMANLLTEMLTIAGFDAHYSWIGTRSIPYSQTLPALCVNNHCISTLFLSGKTYFLDGTESYVSLGQNAFRIQGKEVMVADGEKFKIIPVPLSTADDNKQFTKADFVLENDKLKGKIKVTLSGTQQTDFHQEYQTLPTNKQKEYLSDYLEFGNDNLEAANIKNTDFTNRDVPVVLEGDLDMSNFVSAIGTDKYLSIDFFPKSLTRLIPDEKRIEGYDLDEVIKFEDEFTLTLPANKKAIDLPQPVSFVNPGYEFKGEYVFLNNKLTLKKTLAIKNSIIKKTEFENWKKFINSIKEFNKYFITITNK